MNTLDNIKDKDSQYRRITRLLFYALPPDLRQAVRESGNFLTVATDLFFILYSTYPRLTKDELPNPQLEGARSTFEKLWSELMKIRVETGTVLNFRKSLQAALMFLNQLASKYLFAKEYDTKSFGDLVEYLLNWVVFPQLSKLDTMGKAEKGQPMSGVSKWDNKPFERGQGFTVPWEVVRKFSDGFIDGVYSAQGNIGSTRRSGVIMGVTRSNNPTRAKLEEVINEELFYVKLAYGELKSREYGELDVPVIITVDFSSSTDVNLKTSVIRIISLGIMDALNRLRSRYEFVFFKDYPQLVRGEEVLNFITDVKADGGTNINKALELADNLASSLGEDAEILLVTDCEDNVNYEPAHRTATVVVNDPSGRMDEMTTMCVSYFNTIGSTAMIRGEDVDREPKDVGRRIGEMLSM